MVESNIECMLQRRRDASLVRATDTNKNFRKFGVASTVEAIKMSGSDHVSKV